MRCYLGLSAAVLCLGLSVGCGQSTEPASEEPSVAVADRVFTGGSILTVDEDFSIAQAIAIRNDRILAVGSNEEILALAGPDTDIDDLGGRTVVPGLIENHMHFVRAARDWYRHVRWDDVTSRATALALVAERARELPEGEWVVVIGGWNFAQFLDNGELFTTEELDTVLPDVPLYIQEGYRRGFVNSKALEAAGVGHDTVLQGPGGIVRDESGNLTGELVGARAMNLVASAMPDVADDVWDASLQQTIENFHRFGMTTVYDVGGNSVTPGHYEAVKRTADTGDLTMRVFYSLNLQNGVGGSPEEIIAALEARTPDRTGLRFAQFGWGEWTYQPMRAQPFEASQQILDDYRAIALTAAENGWQMNEHSSRDVKIRAMLDVFESVNEAVPIADLRWTIAHTNDISPESIQRANDLGMVYAVHSSSRMLTPEVFASGTRPPPPIRSIQESGGVWGLGSDGTTVASPNPFHNIGWAVSGLSPAGETILEETVSREQALTAHTRTNAYLMFREDHLGSLEPGKLADFAVLDRDYMTVPEDELKDLRSVMTVVGGDVVYSER